MILFVRYLILGNLSFIKRCFQYNYISKLGIFKIHVSKIIQIRYSKTCYVRYDLKIPQADTIAVFSGLPPSPPMSATLSNASIPETT